MINLKVRFKFVEKLPYMLIVGNPKSNIDYIDWFQDGHHKYGVHRMQFINGDKIIPRYAMNSNGFVQIRL